MKIEKLTFMNQMIIDPIEYRNMDNIICNKINELIDAFNQLNKENELLIDTMGQNEKNRSEQMARTIDNIAKLNNRIVELENKLQWNNSSTVQVKFCTPAKEEKECICNGKIACSTCNPDLVRPGMSGVTGNFGIKEKEPSIRNCPFCGFIGILCFDKKRQAEKYFVYCPNLICKVKPITDYCETEQEAIAAWNTRAK